MKFFYKVADKEGKFSNGFLEAKSIDEAAMSLRSQQLMPIKIIPQNEKPLFSFGKKQRFSTKDLVFFTRQLASMLSSGLTLMQALRLLREQMVKKNTREVMNGIIADIEGGASFSDAIAKYPDIFTPIFISLIKTSESSGLLDKILDRMAVNLEKSQKLRTQIKSAFLYPVIVIIMMIGVVIIMVVFVIPQISSLYKSFNIELPGPTKLLLGMSTFVTSFWYLLIGFFLLGGVVFRRWHKTPSGRLLVDYIFLRIPLFGKLSKETMFTEFTRTFGLLVGSGNVIVPSLKQAGSVINNVIYQHEVDLIAERVEKGVTIGDAISASTLFPPYLIQMVKIGEQTGKLDDSLLRTSEYYEQEVEQTVKTLTTAMEPAIMIILGIGVGFLLISVITPIYKLTSAF